MFHGRIAHGMLSAGFISAVLGMQLPGPGTIYMGQELRFVKPVCYSCLSYSAKFELSTKIPKNFLNFLT